MHKTKKKLYGRDRRLLFLLVITHPIQNFELMSFQNYCGSNNHFFTDVVENCLIDLYVRFLILTRYECDIISVLSSFHSEIARHKYIFIFIFRFLSTSYDCIACFICKFTTWTHDYLYFQFISIVCYNLLYCNHWSKLPHHIRPSFGFIVFINRFTATF